MVWYSCVNLASGVGHLLYTRVYTVSSRGRLLFGLRRLKKKKKPFLIFRSKQITEMFLFFQITYIQ